MSYARDDISLTSSLPILQTNYFDTRTVKQSETEETTSSDNQNAEDVELSDGIQNRIENINSSIEEVQEGVGYLDVANQGLSKISDNLQNTYSLLDDAKENDLSQSDYEKINKELKKNFENIDKAINDATINDVNTLDGSSYNKIKLNFETDDTINISSNFGDTSLEALNLPESKDVAVNSEAQIDTLQKKVKDALKEVSSKQNKISDDQDKLQSKVSNLIVIGENISSSQSSLEDTDIASNIKEEAMKGIMDNPEKSLKVQVTNLDENLILGLLSIHQK